MIRALPHQQQPQNAVYCQHCKQGFNNVRRFLDHLMWMYRREDPQHPMPALSHDSKE